MCVKEKIKEALFDENTLPVAVTLWGCVAAIGTANVSQVGEYQHILSVKKLKMR